MASNSLAYKIWNTGTGTGASGILRVPEAEAQMMQGVRKLGPADWKSGDRLWLMDLIVPFGGQEDAAKELRETVFKGKKVKSLQPAKDDSGMAVVEW